MQIIPTLSLGIRGLTPQSCAGRWQGERPRGTETNLVSEGRNNEIKWFDSDFV